MQRKTPPSERWRRANNLPEAEKYLIAANRFRIAKDYPKAIEAYQNLAKVSPDNPESVRSGRYLRKLR